MTLGSFISLALAIVLQELLVEKHEQHPRRVLWTIAITTRALSCWCLSPPLLLLWALQDGILIASRALLL